MFQNISNPLEVILENDYIYPVFQPIVSLKDGEVFAYEALSRINSSEIGIGIESLFKLAEQFKVSWELESICRKKSLESYSHQNQSKHLFLNVNPNIIYDEKFQEGFTKAKLEELGIQESKITFEITERVSVIDKTLFYDTIEHYKIQNYGIAIDDVGSGFSGLNVIVDIKPKFIKLDMHLIRNIDMDQIKLILCRALVDFCKNANIKIIAEGIEKEEELEELIKLGIDYGQGYFLGRPNTVMQDIDPLKKAFIKSKNEKQFSLQHIFKKMNFLNKASIF